MEAQRYPADYDGILAGAPASYWTALLSTAAWDTQALTLDAAVYSSSENSRDLRRRAAACDELDGVRDGILNDPRQCHFDPADCCVSWRKHRQVPDPRRKSRPEKDLRRPAQSIRTRGFPRLFAGAKMQGRLELWITGPAPSKACWRSSQSVLFEYGL